MISLLSHVPKLRALADVWQHPANAGCRSSAVAASLRWQLESRLGRRSRKLRLVSGSVMLGEPGMPAAHLAASFRGLYDFEEMSFLQAYLRPGDRMLDIGANAGVYALMAGPIIGEAGRIDCFEPTPATRRRLLANLTLSGLGHVKVHPLACSDRAGRVSFAATADDHTNQLASADTPGTIEVDAVRVEDVVGHLDYAVGKLDIEGAEPLALAGAESMLARRSPPVWILELSWRVEQFGHTVPGFAAWLQDAGFDLLAYDVASRSLVEADLSQRHCNVLAVARDRHAEVEGRLAR